MKNALALCSLALNPSAPAPTATMVKLEDGHMVSFGGLFCVRVPVQVSVGACFSPAAVSTFFRKARKAVVYTIHKKKLQLQEGNEKLRVSCLPPEEMPTLDVLADPTPVDLDMTHFKSLTDIIDPAASRIWLQGVTFRYGMAEASNASVVIAAISGLPDEFEFNLPVDSAKALMKFKSPVVAIAQDERAVKFFFEDGSSLTSLVIVDLLNEVGQFFQGEWKPLKIKNPEDLLKIPCEEVAFDDGDIRYTDGDVVGNIEGIAAKGIKVIAGKASLDALLKISGDIRVAEDNFRFMAVSENCRAICATRAHPGYVED